MILTMLAAINNIIPAIRKSLNDQLTSLENCIPSAGMINSESAIK